MCHILIFSFNSLKKRRIENKVLQNLLAFKALIKYWKSFFIFRIFRWFCRENAWVYPDLTKQPEWAELIKILYSSPFFSSIFVNVTNSSSKSFVNCVINYTFQKFDQYSTSLLPVQLGFTCSKSTTITICENLFKGNKKDNRITLLTSFWCFYC